MRLQVHHDHLARKEEFFGKGRIPERRSRTHCPDDIGGTFRGCEADTPSNASAYDGSVITPQASPEERRRGAGRSPSADLLSGLDADQRRAVVSSAPLLAVIAGAGSGKTSVLTRRVAWRCLEGSADPMHTAVITFTRQAASELRRRLRNLGLNETVLAGTFHALSLSFLQQHWDKVGKRPPTIVQDRRRLIGEVLGPRRTTSIDALAAEIDWARARNISPRNYARTAAAAQREANAVAADVEQVMSDLETLKAKRGIIDLDDLLSSLIELANTDPEFASIMRWRLRSLYVDEAQDMNPLQRSVLDLWRADRDDLTLVGDPSQAIYGFNGSDPTILLRLEDHFPGIEVVRLDTNYRCTPQIVRAGLSALSHLDTPVPPLRSGRPDGTSVSVYGFDDEAAEASGVVRLLESLFRPFDSWRQFAVLARTNAQLPAIRSALESAGIPVRSVATNHDDSLKQCLKEVAELPSRSRLAAWARDVRLHDEVEDGAPASEMSRSRAVRRVADAIDEFLSDGGSDGRSFSTWVRTHRPFDDSSNSDGVDVLTFHAAKGREWDTVILIGFEDGFVPHSSAKSSMSRDEEIRLAYVAVTRAADRLVVSYSRSRKGRQRRRSPLIDGISTVEPVSPPTPEFLENLRHRREDRADSDPVLDELHLWRSNAGRVSGVDARLICPDDVLREIARRRPTSLAELEDVPGLGSPLIARTGRSILDAVRRGVNPKADD